MGVAAIDVPLYEFERLFQSYRLGVGGYAFVIDQNGNILTHPDFRPTVRIFNLNFIIFWSFNFYLNFKKTQFQGGILKPAYNSIDMAEVELMDDGYPLRDFSSYLVEVIESHKYIFFKHIFHHLFLSFFTLSLLFSSDSFEHR
jgi:voltage-dependent calcium channel alpha-2/delta-3